MSRPRLGNSPLTVGRADANVNTRVAAIQHQHATSWGGGSESLRAVPVALLTRRLVAAFLRAQAQHLETLAGALENELEQEG